MLSWALGLPLERSSGLCTDFGLQDVINLNEHVVISCYYDVSVRDCGVLGGSAFR